MSTDCTATQLELQGFGRRKLVAEFDGGRISSDGGLPLLAAVEQRRQLISRFARCFTDVRDSRWVEHSVEELVGQRVLGLALGYEDLVDHDELRTDPLLAAVVGRRDLTGEKRSKARDRGKPLAGKSTLHRLEAGALGEDDAYRKITVDPKAVDAFFVEAFLDAFESPPERIILDLDATDDPLHGTQEGRFFHGYYRHYCYLPLYIFCGDHLLCARLRTSNRDASAGSLEEIRRIVAQIRTAWPEVEIWLRADSGFARDPLMAWCEDQEGVEYVFGMARNPRLQAALEGAFEGLEALRGASGEPVRVYEDFRYSTRESWTRERRIIGKAEITHEKKNPRFVVTSLPAEAFDAATVYETLYCARGEMENRIKEQLSLFADRTSAHWMKVNQLRLWFSSVAYMLVSELRRLGLAGTEMGRAQCGTIRLKLLKIGARIRVSVRRIQVSLASGHPYQAPFRQAWHRLARAGPPVPA